MNKVKKQQKLLHTSPITDWPVVLIYNVFYTLQIIKTVSALIFPIPTSSSTRFTMRLIYTKDPFHSDRYSISQKPSMLSTSITWT